MWIFNEGDIEAESLAALVHAYGEKLRHDNEIECPYIKSAYWWSAGDSFIHVNERGLEQINSKLRSMYDEECICRYEDGGRVSEDGVWSW